jgi:hypothetical protein
MKFKRNGWTLVEFCLAWGLLLGSLGTCAVAQTPTASAIATTSVTDTVYRADGTAAQGTVLISWPAFTLATGASVPAGSTSVTIGANGALNVSLVANAGATPMGSYYTVVYHLDDGSVTHEYWVVPERIAGGSGTVQVSAIRSSVLPMSVAMQTVSKAYVDTAIATAMTGHPLDSSTPYVLKTGDAMSGPLALPADPTTPTQASDKHYVDTQVAGLSAGLAQKVSTQPQATQAVAQPAGTQLQVNNLNGAEYASQYVTGAGSANPNNNGIANAAASADCVNGCDVVAEHTYPSTETPAPTTWNNGTHLEDLRGGQKSDSYFNPQGGGGFNVGQTIDVVSTQSAADIHAQTGGDQIYSVGMVLNNEGLTGGVNTYPRNLQATIPYFKTTYSAMQMKGTYNTPGQHVLFGSQTACYGVGDCLMGSRFLTASGGFRDDADEGAHPFDLQVSEDTLVFEGTCASGCTTGATTLQIAPTAAPGTQGEGRYLIDTNPTKVITTGTLTGGLVSGRQPSATFAGTNFPVSTFLETAQAIPTQANTLSPGTVTVPITAGGVPTGFATNTAVLAASTGVACVSDVAELDGRPLNFETAAYTVVDGSHIQLTLNRPHATGATIAIGGLCGYGLEQKVDTLAGIRQVFPVIGATSPTTLLYAGGQTSIIGQQGFTSAFANVNLVVASIARTGNVVSVTVAGTLGADVNGLTMTVQGVTDSSYNGSFAVTTTGPNSLTYVDNGPDSTSAGGTISLVTGSYALYPMAEVLGVYNAASKSVDGQMTLAANTVNWAAGDTVEEPHYFQEDVYPDTEYVNQFTPRPSRTQSAGVTYGTNNGPGLIGYQIANAVPASQYYGNGGTHTAPDIGLNISGAWQHAVELQAGENAAIRVHCNSHGCGKWNSSYDLFQMDNGVGQDQLNYAPQNSTLRFELRGSEYKFSPQAFTANTINVTTLNAGSIHGLFTGTVSANSLPVFAASGATHGVGAVPDPGPLAGNTKFLREDGTWAYAGSQVASASGYVTVGPKDLPQRTNLLGEYLLTEGTGTIAHDTSGNGNDATIHGATWEGTQDLNFAAQGQYVQLPTNINAAKAWQFALYNPVYGSATAPQAPGYGWAASFPANPSLLCGTTTGQLCLIGASPGRSMAFQAFNTDGTTAGEPMAPGWHVFTLLCGSNVGGVITKTRYLYDGAEVSSYTTQGDAGTCPAPTSGNYQIGGSAQYTQTWFLGKVAGAWAWSTPLSFGDGVAAAQSALTYLKAKGVQTEFRKVASSSPVILAGFDSRTFGIGVTANTAWPAVMSLTDGSYTRVNLGSPGQTAYDACVQFDLTYAEQMGPGTAPAIAVLWGGVNDMLYTSQTPRQIANSLHCLVKKAKAAGARVVLGTEISCGNSATCDASKDALDTILRAEAFGWGVDNLADLATDVHLGADGASANAACFPDYLHPGPGCEPYITAIMGNAVNELLGSTETQRHTTAAATYTEVAGDRFLDLTGTSQQSITLPDCTGYSLPRQVLNLGAVAGTVNPMSGQTLLGSGAVAVGARSVFLPVPGAPAVGGCKWERTQ